MYTAACDCYVVCCLCCIFLFYSRFCLSIRPPPGTPRTDTLCPYSTRFRTWSLRRVSRPESLGPHKTAAPQLGALWSGFPLGVVATAACATGMARRPGRSEEHTSELQSLMRISYAVFCLKKKKQTPVT